MDRDGWRDTYLAEAGLRFEQGSRHAVISGITDAGPTVGDVQQDYAEGRISLEEFEVRVAAALLRDR